MGKIVLLMRFVELRFMYLMHIVKRGQHWEWKSVCGSRPQGDTSMIAATGGEDMLWIIAGRSCKSPSIAIAIARAAERIICLEKRKTK